MAIFSDLYPRFITDKRFTDMLGQPGEYRIPIISNCMFNRPKSGKIQISHMKKNCMVLENYVSWHRNGGLAMRVSELRAEATYLYV